MSEKPPKVGQLITEAETRDAIHIAVAPVTNDDDHALEPGEAVAFMNSRDNEFVQAASKNAVGIVDPYLRSPVKKGEKFWMFLYPNTITSLRHNWSHPSFHDVDPRVQAESWIRFYAISIHLSYEQLLQGAFHYLESGDSLYDGATLDGVSTNDTFWEKFEILTGSRVPEEKKNDFFSCSC